MQSETRTIDGYEVELSALPAWQSTEVLHMLLKLAGPLLGGLAASATDKAGAGPLAAAVGALFERSTPADFTALLRKLTNTCRVKVGDKALAFDKAMDLEFAGKLLTVFKIAAFAIEVNYRDFFDALKSRLGGLGELLGPKLRARLDALLEQPSTSSSTDPATA